MRITSLLPGFPALLLIAAEAPPAPVAPLAPVAPPAPAVPAVTVADVDCVANLMPLAEQATLRAVTIEAIEGRESPRFREATNLMIPYMKACNDRYHWSEPRFRDVAFNFFARVTDPYFRANATKAGMDIAVVQRWFDAQPDETRFFLYSQIMGPETSSKKLRGLIDSLRAQHVDVSRYLADEGVLIQLLKVMVGEARLKAGLRPIRNKG